MMGNIGPLAIFEVKIGNIQNIFYMMGNSRLKLTFMLNLWAVGKRMTRRQLERELPQQYPSRRLLAFSYTCVLDWDGTRRVTFSQRRGRHSYGQPTRATQPRTHVYSQARDHLGRVLPSAVVTATGARLKDRHIFQQTWWDSFLGHTCVEDYWQVPGSQRRHSYWVILYTLS